MGVGELVSMIAAGLTHQLGGIEFEDLISRPPPCCVAIAVGSGEDPARSSSRKIEKRIYPEMRELVEAPGARPLPCPRSSALTIRVDPVARFLGIEHVDRQFDVDGDAAC